MTSRPPPQKGPAFNQDMHNTPRASYVSLATTEVNRGRGHQNEQYRSPLSSSLFRDDFRTPVLDYTLSWNRSSTASTREGYFDPRLAPPANVYDVGSPFSPGVYEQDVQTQGDVETDPSEIPGTLFPPLSKDKATTATATASSKSSKPAKRRVPVVSGTAMVLGAVFISLVVEEVVLGALWIFMFSLRSPEVFFQAYFGTKIQNLIAAVVVAMIGLALQGRFFKQLTQDQLTLQLWSFLLIFTTYLAASIAAGAIKKIMQQAPP
ncbi:uncharacterized protein J3D65DRAFT_672444 [Phyllosticta citribraziliensis]|uniref:Uncharacterized protein n=1 Tax=Phyllosticta citribraziliensis TaxID=989973 RepID=A0ABR1L439_9PEZI